MVCWLVIRKYSLLCLSNGRSIIFSVRTTGIITVVIIFMPLFLDIVPKAFTSCVEVSLSVKIGSELGRHYGLVETLLLSCLFKVSDGHSHNVDCYCCGNGRGQCGGGEGEVCCAHCDFYVLVQLIISQISVYRGHSLDYNN